MRRRQHHLLLLLLIALAWSVFPGEAIGQRAPARPAQPAVTTATISGQIVDEAGLPVEGATIAVAGSEVKATSGPNGAFTLPGVPAGTAVIEVSREGYSTLNFDFQIAAGVTATVKLTLATLPPPITPDSAAEGAADTVPDMPQAPVPSGKVNFQGMVVDTAGRPIFGAIVEEASSAVRTMSDSSGRFRLVGVSPGLAFFRARKIGFLAEYFPLTGTAGKTITATIKLRPAAGQQLATVTVRDRDLSANTKLKGFYERAALGIGVFIERDEIVRRNASQLSEILRGRNGVNVYGGGANGAIIAGRGLRMAGGQGPGICPLPLILDGVLVPLTNGLTVDRVVNVQDVRAIEVYNTGPQVPAALANGQTDCGAIVVWTR